VIYTIGHSTRTTEAFVEILEAHGIRQIADVRRLPRSRRHPHFTEGRLAAFLHERGLGYRHFPALGGLRAPRADSTNTALKEPAFRGYADYMATAEFREALATLRGFAAEAPSPIMCAEAHWMDCHRQLLADALVVHGVPIEHLISPSERKPHTLSGFARIEGTKVIYPGLV
jgi:uncharacterized protein (DUF488 family)